MAYNEENWSSNQSTRVWAIDTPYGIAEYGVVVVWQYNIDPEAKKCKFKTIDICVAEYDSTNGMSGCAFDAGASIGSSSSYNANSACNWRYIYIGSTTPNNYYASGGCISPEYEVSFDSNGDATAYIWWWCYPNSNAPSYDVFRPNQWDWINYAVHQTGSYSGVEYRTNTYYQPCVIKVTRYSVAYNANGGSPTPATQLKTPGTALTVSGAISRSNSSSSYTVTCNKNGGTNGDATKTGTITTAYSFNNWKTSAGATINARGSYTTDANTTLTAQWNSNTTYGAVTLPTLSNSQWTSTIPITFNYNYNSLGTYRTENITKTITWQPLGWSTSSTATSAAYSNGSSQTFNSNTTLYAVWNKRNPTYSSITIPAVPAREKYTFLGWNTQPNGSGTMYAAETSFTINNDNPVTLYAQWKLRAFNVTLNNQDDPPTTSSVAAIIGNPISISSLPTYSGHTFVGYYDAANDGNMYIDSAGHGVKPWTQEDDNGVLYAHWENVPPLNLTKATVTKSLTTITVTVTTPAYKVPEVRSWVVGSVTTTPVCVHDPTTNIATVTLELTGLTRGTTYTGTLSVAYSGGIPATLTVNEKTADVPEFVSGSLNCAPNLDSLSAAFNITQPGLTTSYYVSASSSLTGENVDNDPALIYGPVTESAIGIRNINLDITNSTICQEIYKKATNPSNTLYLIAVTSGGTLAESVSTAHEFTLNYSNTNISNNAKQLVPKITAEFFNELTDVGKAYYKHDGTNKCWEKDENGIDISTFIQQDTINNNYYFIGSKSKIQLTSDSSNVDLKYSATLVKKLILCTDGWHEFDNTNYFSPTNNNASINTSDLKIKIQDSRGFYSNEITVGKIIIQPYAPPEIKASIKHKWQDPNHISDILLTKLSGTFTGVFGRGKEVSGAEVYKPQVAHLIDIGGENTEDEEETTNKNNTITSVKILKGDGTPVSTLTAEQSYSTYLIKCSIQSLSFNYDLVFTEDNLLDQNQANDAPQQITFKVADRFEESVKTIFLPGTAPAFSKDYNDDKNQYGFNTNANEDATFTFKTEDDTNGFVVDDVDMRVKDDEYNILDAFMNPLSS